MNLFGERSATQECRCVAFPSMPLLLARAKREQGNLGEHEGLRVSASGAWPLGRRHRRTHSLESTKMSVKRQMVKYHSWLQNLCDKHRKDMFGRHVQLCFHKRLDQGGDVVHLCRRCASEIISVILRGSLTDLLLFLGEVSFFLLLFFFLLFFISFFFS